MIYNPYTPQYPNRPDEWVESAENEPPFFPGMPPHEMEEYNREMRRFLTDGTGEVEQAADDDEYWAAYESDCKVIAPPIGPDDYPDYGDLNMEGGGK